MKKDVKLIEDYSQSSFDVTIQNLKLLDLTLADIAGIFLRENDEYRRIADDLADVCRIHDDMITNICLSQIFHHNLLNILKEETSKEKFIMIVALASEMPFHLVLPFAQHAQIPLNKLKENFEAMYNFGRLRLQAKDILLSSKFHIWKFAHTINLVYNNQLYIINLESIEQGLDCNNPSSHSEFQTMKENYLKQLAEKKESDKSILLSIFNSAKI